MTKKQFQDGNKVTSWKDVSGKANHLHAESISTQPVYRESVMSEAERLLPCPFCGGEATMWGACGQAPEQWVKCNRCGASGDTASGEERAAKKWNTRAQSARIAALEEALRGIIGNWDSKLNKREEFRNCDGEQYWAPSASMINSQYIAAARKALGKGSE